MRKQAARLMVPWVYLSAVLPHGAAPSKVSSVPSLDTPGGAQAPPRAATPAAATGRQDRKYQ